MPIALTRRAKLLIPLLLLALLALSYWRLRSDAPPRTEVSLSGEAMGTTYSVVLVGEGTDELAEAVQASLDQVEQQMSTYIEESELMRFNSSRSTEVMPVSADFAEVVEVSLAIHRLSKGALDVTVRPLVALWGFGAGAQSDAPTEAQVAAARAKIGSEHLKLVPLPDGKRALSKSKPELELDLSAVAKGYGVDQVARLLSDRGFTDYIVEVGGEVRASGTKANGAPWRIGIEKPDSTGQVVLHEISLTDSAMATSGDYRNFYMRDGRRISHTIDPRDGRPISHHLASISVLHQSTAWADGWATALNVLGPVEGRDLAESQGLAALFLVRLGDGRFESIATKAFAELTKGAQLTTPSGTAREP